MRIEDLSGQIGQVMGQSDWITLDQARIDDFARVTEDAQFIHVDPDAAAQTPFGGTIAHGFLTLSMLSAMTYDALSPREGEHMGVNYGFDRIRFISPVPAGSRIRGLFTLAAVREVKPGEWELAFDVTVEIDGFERPALAARWLQRRYVGG